MARKSSTKQDGEATTEEVPGLIVTYTEEEINTVTAANASDGPRTEALREVYINSPTLPSVVGNNTTAMNNGSDGLTARALGELFTNVSFNNSPVNISINLRSNVHPSDSVDGSCPW